MELTVKEAIARAAALCSKKEYCLSEIRTKLERWEVSDQDEVLAYLLKEKFIDEARYTRFFVRDKFRFNKWGRIKIRYHLNQKHVPDHYISEALAEEIKADEYLHLLEDLIKAQRKKVKGNSDYEIKAKLYRFAYSRGFEPELVNQFL